MEGWIKLHRMIQDNDLWHCEPFSRGQAWVDLLLLANHKESFFFKRGNKVMVKRGQVGRSEVELSDRWKWSRTKVRKFLKDLEKEQQIIIHKSSVTQLLTIVNYDEYQEKEQQKDSRKTAERQQKDIYKNDKNKKEGKEEKYKYVEQFKKIQNGEITRQSELDKNFHFGLFPDEWSLDFQNSVLGMWRYLESKEFNPNKWGVIGTLSSQISILKICLNDYSEKEVTQCFADCRANSSKTWKMYLGREKNKTQSNKPKIGVYSFNTKISNA